MPIKGGQLVCICCPLPRETTDTHAQFAAALQINVAASVARYDVPIGSENLTDGTPWVGEATTSDIQKDFEGWGPDVVTLLRCMPEKTGRWSIHVVHPELERYSRGHVAIVGDAVS